MHRIFYFQTLYNLGARKVAVFSTLPIGCLPQALFVFPTNSNGLCVDFINQSVQLFNTRLISLINDLNTNLSGSKFTYVNTYGILSGNFTTTLGNNTVLHLIYFIFILAHDI